MSCRARWSYFSNNKTGKKNSKGKISFNTYTGFQETARTLPTLNATQYALLLKVMPTGALPKRNLGRGSISKEVLVEMYLLLVMI
jgi:hypothetical protein